MPAFDNPAEYLDDFGVACESGGVQFTGLFDTPDAMRQLGEVGGISRDYLLTYATAHVTLKRTNSVLVGGVEYQVREVPRAVGDGTFAEATLTKL